jgi:hypothetical protein
MQVYCDSCHGILAATWPEARVSEEVPSLEEICRFHETGTSAQSKKDVSDAFVGDLQLIAHLVKIGPHASLDYEPPWSLLPRAA